MLLVQYWASDLGGGPTLNQNLIGNQQYNSVLKNTVQAPATSRR